MWAYIFWFLGERDVNFRHHHKIGWTNNGLVRPFLLIFKWEHDRKTLKEHFKLIALGVSELN